jgi:6,7-dimethyl-8-ribityllumazine synthase
LQALLEYGVRPENIVQDFDVPGSFELPFAAQGLARSGRVDTVICFGVLIKGETMHFEYISGAVSQGTHLVLFGQEYSRECCQCV